MNLMIKSILGLALATLPAFGFSGVSFNPSSPASPKVQTRESLVESTFIDKTIVSAGVGGKSFFGSQVTTGFASWSWILNDRLMLGLSLESMIFGKTRQISPEYDAEVSLWYLGPKAEYVVLNKGLWSLSAGAALHYGNVGYRIDAGNEEMEWYKSEFTSIQPFAKVSLNFSKQVEFGVETLFAYAKGVSLVGLTSKNLSGVGGNIFLARRF